MTKESYLSQSKNFVKTILEHRKSMDKNNCGFVPKAVRMEIPNIENAMVNLKCAIEMKVYLLRKKSFIHFLIPANKQSWTAEFTTLLNTNLNNQNE